nr:MULTISPECIES: hypothetical protein [unclassified Bacillus (in: firmicutes)]
MSYSGDIQNPSSGRQMLNNDPEVTIFFWIIKILATTVGETAADFLNEQLPLTQSVQQTLHYKFKLYAVLSFWIAYVLDPSIRRFSW